MDRSGFLEDRSKTTDHNRSLHDFIIDILWPITTRSFALKKIYPNNHTPKRVQFLKLEVWNHKDESEINDRNRRFLVLSHNFIRIKMNSVMRIYKNKYGITSYGDAFVDEDQFSHGEQ